MNHLIEHQEDKAGKSTTTAATLTVATVNGVGADADIDAGLQRVRERRVAGGGQSVRDRSVRALQRARPGEGFTAVELAEAVGRSASRTSRVLRDLRCEGVVVRDERAAYRLSEGRGA